MPRRIAAALAMVLFFALFGCASGPNSTSTSVTAQAASILLPAPADSSENALWGFIDTNGHWVIQPQFQDAYRFHEGLARVKLNGKWGYVGESGTVVIPAQYTEAWAFNGGLARVATGPANDWTQDFKIFLTATDYGFIDKTGKMVIPATWKDAGDFSEGLAPVMQEDTQEDSGTYGEDFCGYVDTKGQLVIPLKFTTATTFSEGLAAVYADEGWGYIDKTGAWAIKPMPNVGPLTGRGVPDDDFLSAMNLPVRRFQGGFALVAGLFGAQPNPDQQTWRFIDKTGRQTGWGQTFDEAGSFSEGLAPVKDGQSGLWGFIDTSGKVVIAPQFGEYPFGAGGYLLTTQGFHQGLAVAAALDGKWGYIDKIGNWVIQPQFSLAYGFSGGFAYTNALAALDSPTSTLEALGGPETLPRIGPLEIIDLTGRIIYKAPEASPVASTSSS